jgi:hypothetical protein
VILFILAGVALLGALALASYFLLSLPPSRALPSGSRVPVEAPPGGAALHREMTALTVPVSQMAGAVPKVGAGELLGGLPAAAPAPVDLTLIDVHDDRDAADRELWRTVRGRLEKK